MILACLLTVVAASVASAAPDFDAVMCVPWQGDPLKQHTAISGEAAQIKAVVKTTNGDTFWYRWIYGDGTSSAVMTASGNTVYNLETTHTYTAPVGTPFTAQLQVDNVDNSMSNVVSDNYLLKIEQDNLDSEINRAIDNGLWALHKRRATSGSLQRFPSLPADAPLYYWGGYSSYYESQTAAACQAFLVNGHKESGNSAEDPYVETVTGGLNALLHGYWNSTSGAFLESYNIPATNGPSGLTFDCDTNDNGKGIQTGYSGNSIYQGGMVIDALIATGTPAKDTGRDFDGDGNTETYYDVVQDMVDQYLWGQDDSGSDTGGWRYSWNSDADNSSNQWAAIGLIPANREWGMPLPANMLAANTMWLDYSYYAPVPQFGYDSPTRLVSGTNYATTPSGMVQMVMSTDYDTPGSTWNARWNALMSWFATNWNTYVNTRNHYGQYAFVKAMRLSGNEQLPGSPDFNWYRGDPAQNIKGLARFLVDDQETDGTWPNGGHRAHPGYYGESLGTAWGVLMLRAELFAAAPIACFTADPNPTFSDFDVSFDPSCSGHSEPGKDIDNLVLFEWDFDSNGSYEVSSATPDIQLMSFHAEDDELPKTFPVTLRVTDDEGLMATFTLDVVVSLPPHPPVADAGGPYVVSQCQSDKLLLDGSASFDPDEGQSEAGQPADTITAWGWDLVPPLTNFDNESGETVELIAANSDVSTYFPATGTYDIGLQVTDNTSQAYPTSGQPDLTDADFTTVTVYPSCDDCTLDATIGCAKVTLTWANPGSYEIWRSAIGPNQGFQSIDAVDNVAVYEDTDVVDGTTYWYRLKGDNCLSTYAEITYIYDPQVCEVVSDLTCRPKMNAVQLTWTAYPGAQAYNIYRSLLADVAVVPGNLIASDIATDWCTYYDDTVTNGVTYNYRVEVVCADTGLPCGYSNVCSATPVARDGRGPGAPRGAAVEMTVETALNRDWVYQNTSYTSNAVTLTVSVDSPDGPQAYDVSVTRLGGAGEVTIEPTADPMVWKIFGGPAGQAAAAVELQVTVTEPASGSVSSTTQQVAIRRLGDIDGDGSVGGTDKVAFNNRANGAQVPDQAPYDLDGDGSAASGSDKAVLNNVLNGYFD